MAPRWPSQGAPLTEGFDAIYSIFPQFVDRTAYAMSFARMGASFLVHELVAIAIYAVIGARLGTLASGTRRMQWLNRASGTLMIGFGLVLTFIRRAAA